MASFAVATGLVDIGIGLVCAAFSLTILVGNRQRPANVFLAAFLFLIAANLSAEGFKNWDPAWAGGNESPWFAVATATAALDPFFLYYFASIHPRRNPLNDGAKVAAVLAFGSAFALSAPFASPDVGPTFGRLLYVGWAAYTAIVYLLVLRAFVEDAGPGSAETGPWSAALALIVVAGWARLAELGAGTAMSSRGLSPEFYLAASSSAAVAIAGAIAWTGRRLPSGARTRLAAWAFGGAGLAIAFSVSLYAIGRPDLPPSWKALGSLLGGVLAAVKWYLFCILVSVAILRHRMLGASLRARRLMARAVLAATFLLIGLIVLAAASFWHGRDRFTLTSPAIVLLAVGAVALQGLRPLLDLVALKIYGVPRPGDSAASLDAYRDAATQAVAEGREPSTDPNLAALRSELDLDEKTAAVIGRMVAAAPPGPLVPGQLLVGRYRIHRLLGRGGSGRAFLARDDLADRDVVVKEVEHGGEAATAKVLQEAKTAGSVEHPNVLRLLDVVERSGSSLLVTEYAAGGSLADRLAREGPLGAGEGARLAHEILSGLEAVHAAGIVHRDLKPANILLGADGSAKIADFGLARVRRGVTAAFENAGVVEGTLAYMAPEQRRGDLATFASDTYAVGTLLRESLRDPPPGVVAVLDRATAQDPAARWPSAAAMREALVGASRTPTA